MQANDFPHATHFLMFTSTYRPNYKIIFSVDVEANSASENRCCRQTESAACSTGLAVSILEIYSEPEPQGGSKGAEGRGVTPTHAIHIGPVPTAPKMEVLEEPPPCCDPAKPEV